MDRRALLAPCLLVPLLLSGCGGGPKYYEVHGLVTFEGEPLEDVQVSFLPDDPGMPTASGVTHNGGEFYLFSGVEGRRGVQAGTYRVVFIQLTAAQSLDEAMKEMRSGKRREDTQRVIPPRPVRPTPDRAGGEAEAGSGESSNGEEGGQGAGEAGTSPPDRSITVPSGEDIDESKLSPPPDMPTPRYSLRYYYEQTTPIVVVIDDDLEVTYDLDPPKK